MNRKNRQGGGVALYVDKKFEYKMVERMTAVIDNILEAISTEICMNHCELYL